MFPKEHPILIVDDSSNMRNIICENLRKLGYNKLSVAEEVTGAMTMLEDALYEAKPFRMVISDLNMPGLSGLEFLKKLRGDEAFKQLPFLLITTESEKSVVIEAAISGVSSYVVKPFTADILLARVNEAWMKHNKK